MIGKDEKINRLYLKLKTAFVTFFKPLSKLGEQVKIRPFRSFESFILKEKVLSYFFFLKIACATNLAHKKGVHNLSAGLQKLQFQYIYLYILRTKLRCGKCSENVLIMSGKTRERKPFKSEA
jgi:hypothetical protein